MSSKAHRIHTLREEVKQSTTLEFCRGLLKDRQTEVELGTSPGTRL